MTKKPLIYLIYNDLVSAVNGIAEKTFLGRPKTISEEVKSFISIDLPVSIYGRVAGKMEVLADSYGTITVYCKAKTDSTLNVGNQTKLVQQVMDLFPINGTHITASRPSILMEGADDYGYQATRISFKIRTKLNAREI